MKSLGRYPYLPITVLALASELVYFLYFVRRFPLLRYYREDTDMNGITGQSHTDPYFLLLISLLFLLLAAIWWLIHDRHDPHLVWWVLGSGAIFAATLTFVYPITAIDIYAYIDHSLLMVQYHQNPIFVPPAAFSADPLMRLSDGWGGVPAPYGPLGVVVDAIPTLLVGRNLLANLILLKLMFSGTALLCAFIVYRLLYQTHPREAVVGALLIAWNPLVLFETSVNGHNDIVMMFFALLGFLSMARGDLTLGPILLVLSVLVKFGTIILLPLFLVYAIGKQPTRRKQIVYLLSTLAVSLLVAAMIYLPFWQGPGSLAALASQDQRYLESFASTLPGLLPGIDSPAAAWAGRILFVPVYLYALWLSAHDFPYLVRASFVGTFFLLALVITNFENWYAIWPVLSGAASLRFGIRASAVVFGWMVFPAAALYGYLGAFSGGPFALANALAYLLAFAPAAALAIFAVGRRPVLEGPTDGGVTSRVPVETGGLV